MAGALASRLRRLLVFRVSEKSVVEDFVTDDPYFKSGLVKAWKVRPWTVVVARIRPKLRRAYPDA